MEPAAEPLIPEAIPPSRTPLEPPAKSSKLPWIPLAALSGACAAFNGVFAKLYAPSSLDTVTKTNMHSTTTELTSSWASAISTAFGLSASNKFVEFIFRAVRFLST